MTSTWRPARWVLYATVAAYFFLSAAAAWGHLHGKNSGFRQALSKNSKSESENAAAYRSELAAPLAIADVGKYPLTDARHLLGNGVTVRNLGVVHLYGFFHEHRGEILGAVKRADAVAAEQGGFFGYCETYAKAHGVTVADLGESRKRERAATWGFLVAMTDVLVAFAVALALCVVASFRMPDRIHPDLRFRWRSVLEVFPNVGKALGTWRCEWRRQADARKEHPVPKQSFQEHVAELKIMLHGMVAPGHRTATWIAGAALAFLLGTHVQFTWGVIDAKGSQSTSPDSSALSRLVDRFSADIDPTNGTARTVSNSAMLHDSRSMYENAKRIAQSMPPGSTLLVLTGDQHAQDFEPWFLADGDSSAVPAAGGSQ